MGVEVFEVAVNAVLNRSKSRFEYIYPGKEVESPWGLPFPLHRVLEEHATLFRASLFKRGLFNIHGTKFLATLRGTVNRYHFVHSD